MQGAIVSSKTRFEENDNLWRVVKQFLIHDRTVYIQMSKDKVEALLSRAFNYYHRDSEFTFSSGEYGRIVKELAWSINKTQNLIMSKFNTDFEKLGRIGIYGFRDIVIKNNLGIDLTGHNEQVVRLLHMYIVKTTKTDDPSDALDDVCSFVADKQHSYDIL